MVELAAFAGQYAEAMSQATGLIVCITIGISDHCFRGARKELLQRLSARAWNVLLMNVRLFRQEKTIKALSV